MKGGYGAVFEGPMAEYMEARNCDLRIMPERISSLEKLTGKIIKKKLKKLFNTWELRKNLGLNFSCEKK